MTYIPLPKDPCGSVMIIDHVHHEIHEGDHFLYTDYLTMGAATQDYLLTTANTTKLVHFLFNIKHLKDTTIELYEATDKSGTTPQTSYNSYRDSTTAAGMTIHKGTSGGTTDGTLIWKYSFGVSTGANFIGGGTSREEEIILKQNTKYILRLTSGTTGNLTSVQFDWYECTFN